MAALGCDLLQGYLFAKPLPAPGSRASSPRSTPTSSAAPSTSGRPRRAPEPRCAALTRADRPSGRPAFVPRAADGLSGMFGDDESERRLQLGSVRFRELLPALLRRAACRRRGAGRAGEPRHRPRRAGRPPLETIDIGTGPNLFPLLCALPRASRLTAWEFSASNVAWLEAELRAPQLRPQWSHFWRVVEASVGATSRFPPIRCASSRRAPRSDRGRSTTCRRRAGTLPPCSSAPNRSPATRRVRPRLRALCRLRAPRRHRGRRVPRRLVRLRGGRAPVPDPRRVAGACARRPRADDRNLHCETIGLVDREIRSGYSGMLFVSGTRRDAGA